MNSENTTTAAAAAARGWIFYDAACAFCVRARQRAGRLFESRGFEWRPLQSPGAAKQLGVPESAFQVRMHLLTSDGRVLHNADALGVLCRSVWWLSPLGILLRVPGFREIGRRSYNWLARNRYCAGGACEVYPKERGGVGFADWMAAGLLPVLAGVAFGDTPAWVLMWMLALAFGFGLKWLAWRDALVHGARPSPKRAFLWFLLWPGLDGRAFCGDWDQPARPQAREWLWAATATASGAALIWGVTPLWLLDNTLIAAWTGMLGVVLFAHFGVFQLLSALYRRSGYHAQPIMNAPFRATSLTDFWSTRWNTAFSIAARRLVLLPLARRVGVPAAGFIVFLASGLVHEAVISVPARAGFGLPTLFFALQGMGVAMERSHIGREWGLGDGLRGRWFVVLFTLGLVYWLFHPPFVGRVMLPLLYVLNNG